MGPLVHQDQIWQARHPANLFPPAFLGDMLTNMTDVLAWRPVYTNSSIGSRLCMTAWLFVGRSSILSPNIHGIGSAESDHTATDFETIGVAN